MEALKRFLRVFGAQLIVYFGANNLADAGFSPKMLWAGFISSLLVASDKFFRDMGWYMESTEHKLKNHKPEGSP